MKVRPSGSRTEEVLKSGGIVDGKNDGLPFDDLEEALRLIEDLKFFLATAPVNWQENQIIRRYYLNSDQGFVSCVFWNSLYYITGTDIVKCCMYRMQKFGREVIQKKKFEEGIFSDLRNLKCGIDATLEQSKSAFLSFLFRNMCLKTQKKQKVFFWFSVPHDKLFADALERDLKRESMGQPSTTNPIAEPARSFKFDSLSSKPLYEQLLRHLETVRSRYEDVVNPSSNTASTGVGSVDSGNGSFSAGVVNTTVSTVDNGQCLEHTSSTPMQLTTDIMNDTGSFTPHNKTESNLSSSSRSGTASFAPQKLVVEPSSLDLNTDSKPSEIFKDNTVVVDEGDRGDFPLDYFPVEIEYPNPEEDADVMMGVQPGVPFLPPSVPYDSAGVAVGDELVPPTATITRFPPYSAHTLFPMPISGTRSNFMTNGKYYASASAMKEKFESPNTVAKDFAYTKGSDSENANESFESSITDNPEIQQEQLQVQQQHQHQQHQNQHQHHSHQYLNPYQKYYSGLYSGYYPPSAIGNGPVDISNFTGEMGTYGYDELFSSQEGYDQAYFLPQEPFNWSFLPQQPVHPPSATAYIPKPFTPSYRSTPISTRNPYVQMAQNPWATQGLTSPYGSKVPSATSKSFPPGAYYPQQAAGSFSRRRPFQGNHTPSSKNYAAKQHSMVSKSTHRKPYQQARRDTSRGSGIITSGNNYEGNINANNNSNNYTNNKTSNDNDNNDNDNNISNNNSGSNNTDTSGNSTKIDSDPRTRYSNSDDGYEDFDITRRRFSIPTPDSNNAQRTSIMERNHRDNNLDGSK
ncbi:homeodomain transcription factor ste12 [Zygosaccharomyces mellis]|uniref:Homeodomain transcription factor ste12 n=1 Tax=Zygosaccharomyces mellis TaxID=42258 RepID=A0A4C2E1J0_9SACH|nr:homeodomain transcription factor ste12 [Zygosaccharomyces mellis]